MEIRAIVLRVAGTNCEIETAHAFELAGAKSDIVHLNELVKKRKSLEDYQILALPGGFSYGDDVSTGILWANELRYKMGSEIKRFVEEGKLVIGICNGFQVLVRTGLLPAFEKPMKKQEATLFLNDIGMYQNRWVHVKHEKKRNSIFVNGAVKMFLPMAHAEGKFIISRKGLENLKENDQIVLKYVDENGNYSGFPWNPNGSIENIAAICNPEGNVFGLMPHPERFLHKYMHPHWTKLQDLPEEGDGLMIFKNAVNYLKKRI